MSGADLEDVDSFRQRARTWLRANAPRRSAARPWADDARWEQAREFQRQQYAAGFSGISWPHAYGGQGLTFEHQRAFNAEAEDFFLASGLFQITLSILGMTLLDHGTDEQRRRYLPPMLRGEALWVQLLSEPGAGSDLGGLTSRATRDGDIWLLRGEKVWSTDAQHCDYAMVLARTDWDVPKHAGLTMFIVPLTAPGVTVLPLRQLTGSAEFCQEFLDDVAVPHGDVLGGVNNGWAVATSLFNHSRTMTAGGGLTGPVFATSRGGDPDPGRDLIDWATTRGVHPDGAVRELVAEARIDNRVSGWLAERCVVAMRRGLMNPAAGSLAKHFGVEILQRRGEIDMELRGAEAVSFPENGPGGQAAVAYLASRTASVAGGTSEILRNTIGERLLGLSKEPAVDRDLPFSQVRHNPSSPSFPQKDQPQT
jgi:alkylation response protein AidB-like acyl-CoA dehydrogenase